MIDKIELKEGEALYVLAYHKIQDSEAFEKQLIYFKNKYSFVRVHGKKDLSTNKNQQSKKFLVITADDGDLSFYLHAFPVLKKYNIPAILFVITDLINTEKPFWWDEIEYYLGKEQGNKKVWQIKSWSNFRRKAYLKELRKTSKKPALKYKQLTTVQLQEMQEAGIIIANHSHTHPMFDQCTEKEIKEELRDSMSLLQTYGFSSEYFAYPNGNYSIEAEELLKKSGVKYSFLFDHKINKGEINPLRISRLIVNDTTPLWKLKLILSGWHGKILPLTRLAGKLLK